MEHKNPWDLPVEPMIAPISEREENHKPSIEEIEGVLRIIEDEENGVSSEDKERKPTIH